MLGQKLYSLDNLCLRTTTSTLIIYVYVIIQGHLDDIVDRYYIIIHIKCTENKI